MIVMEDELGHEPRRGIAFERVFRIAQALRDRHFGLHLDALADVIREETGHPWHLRTIRRDCSLLEYLGVISLENGIVRWTSRGGLLDQSPQTVRDAAEMAALETMGKLRLAE